MSKKKKASVNLMDAPDSVMWQLGSVGYYTQVSELTKTGYVVVDGKVVILRGVMGAAALCDVSQLRTLAAELNGMAEILEYRKDARIKGA